MKAKPVIAVVGATGVVGSEMLSLIEELNLPYSAIRPLASEKSKGEVLTLGAQEILVEELTESSFEDVDIALFAVGASLAEKYVPIAVDNGALVIDNSRQFRMTEGVPLVVPEVNGDQITAETKLVANPNCSTIQLVMVLDKIEKLAKLKRVVVSTYQAVSGAGKQALDELWEQTRSIFNQTDFEPSAFQHQIAFNCIPQIDTILDSGYTREEQKVIEESRKILGLPDLKITCTAVRVPVFNAHAESVNIETENEVDIDSLTKLLADAEGIDVYPNWEDYPMQVSSSSTDPVHVGRMRKDDSVDNGLDLWIVADNLRKGAALNAVQIAKLVVNKFGA